MTQAQLFNLALLLLIKNKLANNPDYKDHRNMIAKAKIRKNVISKLSFSFFS